MVVAPGLDIDLGPSTRLSLLASYQRDEFRPNPGFPLLIDTDEAGNEVGNLHAPRVPRSRFFGIPNEGDNHTEISTFTARLEQDLGDRWLATLALNSTHTDQLAGAERYVYNASPSGDANLYFTDYRLDRESFSGELRLNGTIELLGRPATLVTGIDHGDVSKDIDGIGGYLEYADGSLTGTVPNIYDENFGDIFNPMPTINPFVATTEEQGTGVFGQLQFRPAERLSVLLGGRYDWANTRINNIVTSFDAPTGILETSPNKFTGRAALSFDLRKNVSVYAQYATSFDPVVAATDGQSQSVPLKPETGELFEVGLKSDWLDGKLAINTSIFRLDRKNVALNTGTFSNPNFINAGLQRSDGVELEINGTPLPGWNLSFGGILLDAEFLGDETVDRNVGRTPDGSADWQVGLFTSYELQSGPLQAWGAGLGVYAVDDRGVRNQDAQIDGYERVDLSLFYNGLENTSVGLQVRNVFDTTYIEGSNVRGTGGNFGAPLSVLLTVRHEFGK